MQLLFKIMPLFYYDIAGIIILFSLITFLRSSNMKLKKSVLYTMCIINFIFYLINDYYFYIAGGKILTMLPLQLCNIAVFLVPMAILSGKQLLLDFIFYICAPGAFIALLVPSNDYIGIPYSLMTISFFIFHYMIAIIPLLLIVWGMYKPIPSINKTIKLSITIFLLAGVMHLLNIILGTIFHVEANYFFTIIKYSAPTNPAFQLLAKLIPYDFLYLMPGLIVLYIYMGIIFIFAKIKSKNIIIDKNNFNC